MDMAEKVPLPGTGLEIDSNDGITGAISTVGKAGIGFMLLFVALAIGAFMFRTGSQVAGQDGDVNVPVV